MKQAYVSFVSVVNGDVSEIGSELTRIDRILGDATRGHEIVLVVLDGHGAPQQELATAAASLAGPLAVIVPPMGITTDLAMWEGLSRAAGDFVLEWDAMLGQFTHSLFSDLLDATDEGAELVEVLPSTLRWSTRMFFKIASWLRPGTQPIRHVAARLMSRRVLSDILFSSLSAAGLYRVVLFSQDHLPRVEVVSDIEAATRPSSAERFGEAIDILIMGTRVASRLPAILAGLFALTGVGAILWAVLFYVRGDTPEGWTTILAFLGLATSGIFIVLAFLSGQIRISARAQTRSSWTTVDVYGSMLPGTPEELGERELGSESTTHGNDGHG